jgi:hypothetical protein
MDAVVVTVLEASRSPPPPQVFFSQGVRLIPLGTAAIVCRIVPVPDDHDCGAIGGMRIGRGNRSTWRKTCPSATLSTANPT